MSHYSFMLVAAAIWCIDLPVFAHSTSQGGCFFPGLIGAFIGGVAVSLLLKICASSRSPSPSASPSVGGVALPEGLVQALCRLNIGLLSLNAEGSIVQEHNGFYEDLAGCSAQERQSFKQFLQASSNLSPAAIEDLFQSIAAAFTQTYAGSESKLDIGINELQLDIGEQKRVVLLSWVPLLDSESSQHLRSILLVLEDITAVSSLESNLESTQLKLTEVLKTKELWEVSAGIAHEINTPLFGLIGRITLLTWGLSHEDKMSKEKKLEQVAAIEKNAKRIATIVKSLKTFSRDATADPFTEESLSSILEDALSMVDAKIRKLQVELRVEVDAIQGVAVSCRPSEIGQIVINLLNNAAYAVQSLPSPWVSLTGIWNAREGSVVIRVMDAGPGISPELQQKILNPFFTTKPVGEGTGLGLSISREIAEKHGGSLAYNDQMQHTTFDLTLPAYLPK
ncbi:MAG: ATP-binding protein [Zetaproteobacteria bacterium]|nr:ATP-binding protein [Zetaproteobacteria bacterium]